MGYINKINVSNGTHLIEPTLFAVAGGTSAAYTATIDNFELVTGVTIQLKITANNAASATLSINNDTAKAIQYKGSAIVANILKATCVYTLIYDGTVWHVVGEKLDSNELILPHKLTLGTDGIYQYDGSADVTVPVYTGIASTKNGIAYYSDTTGTFASTAAGSDGYVLIGKGADTAPEWLQATDSNTASTIIKRDESGNFSAGTITASLIGNVTGNVSGSSGSCTGNAATATQLSNTPNNTTTFLRGDNSWSSTLTGGLRVKALETIDTTTNGAQIRFLFSDRSNSTYGMMWAARTANAGGRLVFGQYSESSSGTLLSYREQYHLPEPTADLTANKSYNILTTKDLSFSITGNAATATNVAWSGVTSKPTTLSGYGITNAVQYNGIDNDTGSNAAASSAKAYWANNDKVPQDKIVFAYNSSGTEYTTLFSNRNNQYGTILKWSYADRYIRILRAHPTSGSYNGWYTEDWEKIYAGYADSAATATRINGNLTTCSDASGHNIWVSSDSSGSGIPNIVAGVYITPSTKTITASTFAGSLSGNATSANYLSTYIGSSSNQNAVGALQNCFTTVPKSVGTAVRLEFGGHAMALGYFLAGSSYNTLNTAYGGWFVAHYDIPKYVGISNGHWTESTLLHSHNYSSYTDFSTQLFIRHSTWVKGTQIASDASLTINFVEKGTGTGEANKLGMIKSYATGGNLNTRIGFWAYRNTTESSAPADYFLLAYEWNGSTAVKRTYTDAKVYGAVWNDYAEFRKTNENAKPGQVVVDNDDGSLNITYARLLPGAQVVSDTFGFAIGETEKTKTPLAVSGRVLVYTYQDRNKYHAGQAVCSAPNGTVDIMTRREIETYPDAIVGIVSEIPDYEEWGQDNVKVNGRIWIKVK